MSTNISSTALDFNNIKNKLKTYFAQQPEFTDYNFEASGLSNVLDVLAYNTHFNALIANFATNESFLNTAQLRSSVVSHAESLGYRPRSKVAAFSILGLYVNLSTVSGRPSRIELPIGTEFQAESEEGTFVFRTRQKYYANDDGTGIYEFLDDDGQNQIIVHEGVKRIRTFFVDYEADNQIYVIPDPDMDTSDVTIKVYESPSSSKYVVYDPLTQAIIVDQNSTYFDLKESPNGYYEINFGDGVSFGKKPAVGSKIVVEYNSTSGSDGNGASSFSPSSELTVDGVNYPINVNTQTVSIGGDNKESIESIRMLAPIQYGAQQRLVTALDYKGMILSNFPLVEDVTVWGGEENVPIDYGRVYICLRFKDGVNTLTQELIKQQINDNFSDRLSVMSINNVYVDPVETYLELNTYVTYNPDLTNQTSSYISNLVDTYIKSYFTSNLGGFGETFRRSNLLSGIDELEKSILSSKCDVKIQQRFVPAIGTSASYTIYFPVPLASNDDQFYRIESTQFRYNNKICRFRNRLNSNIIEVITGISDVVIQNIGYYDYRTGTVFLEAFEPQSILGGVNFIKVTGTPADQSAIKPLRNFVLELDDTKLNVNAIQDDGKTKINL